MTDPAPPRPSQPAAAAVAAIEAVGLSKRYRPELTLLRLLALPFTLPFHALVRALGYRRERRPEVDDLSFSVPVGSVVGFLGPNGAGKTTTMKIVANLLGPDAGRALVLGLPVVERYDAVLARLGCMIGEPTFYPYLTGRANLRLAAFFHRGVDPARIATLLELVGMTGAADKRFNDYSTGMKKRLALAFALLHRPEVLILDEPSAGVDPRGRAELRDLILNVSRSERVTVFISSHELSELEKLCDHLVIIEKGRKTAAGTIEELRDRLATPGDGATVRVWTPVAAPTESLLRGLPFVREVTAAPDGYRLTVERGSTPGLAPAFVSAGIELRGFLEEAGSLEEIYLKVTDGTVAAA